MNLSLLALHYTLGIVSVLGLIQCVRVLSITRRDMSALLAAGVNGPKRLIVEGRRTQSAYLLGAFAVLLLGGARVAFAEDYELDQPLVLTMIISFNILALLLGLKEMTIRRNRLQVDAYYDQENQATVTHGHRRSTDRLPGA